MSIKMEVMADGCVRMLWDDAIDLKQFGDVEVSRASHVEFNNKSGLWYVKSARTNQMLRDDFKTRREALYWEKQHYSPGGKGWSELTGE